jgi:hypothetical protein
VHYLFDLKCPRCGKASMMTLPRKDIPIIQLHCGHCLMETAEIVPLNIASVTIVDGDEGVDLFHELQSLKGATMQ